MSGRKTFTAGEVLQAADVNDYLMDQSVMVFAGTAARGSAIPSPTEGMVTYLEDADELQVYTTDWGGVGGGTILQVVSTTKTDAFSAVLASGADTAITGLSVSITPTSTSSKVYVVASVSNTAYTTGVAFILKRDSTEISLGDAAGSRRRVTAGGNAPVSAIEMNSSAINFLDSPATTSSITYSINIMNLRGSSDTVYVNRGVTDTDASNWPRGSSTITVMEVAG